MVPSVQNLFLPSLSLYVGKVMHARLKPQQHRFNYRVFSILIDIDQLSVSSKRSFIFSVNRPNILSFFEKDHGPRDGSNLRKHIDKVCADGGFERPDRVLLWCNPRVLGYTFNPLSIYFCYDKSGHVSTLIYQVHNTFGEDHTYAARISEGENQSGSIRQKADKLFYVSPFLDMDLCYHFRINEPGDTLRIRILERDKEGPVLSASFFGEYQPATTKFLSLGVLGTFGLTWKIIAGIHFEAVLLWFKGAKLRKRPKPPEKTSYPNQNKTVAGE